MSKFLNISTDNTLGGDSASDDIIASQKAVKDYVDSHGGGSYTAGTGIDINNNVISVASPTLTNTATGSNSLTVGGTASAYDYSVNIGYGSIAYNMGTALGYTAKSGSGIAIGYGADASSATGAIQIGQGSNTSNYTFNVGFINGNNYKLLDGATGIIPDARMSSNIARTTDIPAAQVNSDWNAVSGVAEILNKPTLGTMASESASDYTPTSGLATVATTGAYSDLSGKPTIPTVDQTYSASSTNAQSGTAVAQALAVKANTDLSNLTSQGQNIANWSSNVTNCITEIPQDIKLELNNGTLTLKAGSKVYVPNGAGVFDTITTTNDSNAGTPYTNVPIFIYYYNGSLVQAAFNAQESGSTFSITNGFWYDTTNNIIKRINNSGVSYSGISFPIAIVNASNSSWTSIDQVFNGFGYIGSTVFALPGVKGLIPNGRNNDGTLKNTAFSITRVKTATYTTNGTYYICCATNYINFFTSSTKYDPITNYNIYNNTNQGQMIAGTLIISDGLITSFNPKTDFHALDYNDSSTISGWAMPSSRYISLSLGASGTEYTAPANGWACIQKKATAENQYLTIYKTGQNSLGSYADASANAVQALRVYIPVEKGHKFVVAYSVAGSTQQFIFIYAEGEV